MSDKEIKRICLDFRKGLLGKKSSELMCFAVSSPLQAVLSLCDYETKLVSGEVKTCCYTINHYWLEMEDGRIIDATADQFNDAGKKMPKVYIGEKPEFYLPLNSK
jgi:hypothetical protein